MQQVEHLQRFHYNGKEVLLHEDHRWVLPLIAEAQQRGTLPQPVRVILFDRHTDCAEPPPISGNDVFEVCANQISKHDDDWIRAGIRLGLIGDVFIFGVNDRMGDLPLQEGAYGIFGRHEMPAKVNGLGKRAREVLEWTDSPILLDIDLDCFAFPYRDQVWPWTEEMFDAEFGPSLAHWQEFVSRAGLITVCREGGCCGGEAHADRIWQRFASRLLPGLTPA